ncbi:MAG: Lrp/AsnC family transcriptional regulator [Clostridia bacterium]|nr:Lrp/AsnC family transcriptional regulator [Clostridia bacterium]
MDNIDKKILRILSKNANMPTTEISRAVNLSVPAVNKRISKLKENNIIRSFTIVTDGEKVTKPILAFILIVARYNDGVEALADLIEKDPDILECYAVTGEYDYILKVSAKDVKALEDKLLLIKRQKNVLKSYTMLSLMEHKFEPAILPDID